MMLHTFLFAPGVTVIFGLCSPYVQLFWVRVPDAPRGADTTDVLACESPAAGPAPMMRWVEPLVR